MEVEEYVEYTEGLFFKENNTKHNKANQIKTLKVIQDFKTGQ